MAKKYGVWAVRSGGSVFGAAEDWCKHYGKIIDFETFESAADYAQELNRESRSPNVRYSVKEKEPEKHLPVVAAAVSNYTGMDALIGVNGAVYLGKRENYHRNDAPSGCSYYDNDDGSLCFIFMEQKMFDFLYGKGFVLSQAEMLHHGLTAENYAEYAELRDGVLRQFEQNREICFGNVPFEPPKQERTSVREKLQSKAPESGERSSPTAKRKEQSR